MSPTQSAQIQRLKDAAHEKLLARSVVDYLTDCHVYTGTWQARTGLGLLCVGGTVFTAHRVALWVYQGGFDLWDTRKRVFHARCRTPACINPKHLRLAASAADLMHILAALGRCKGPSRRDADAAKLGEQIRGYYGEPRPVVERVGQGGERLAHLLARVQPQKSRLHR